MKRTVFGRSGWRPVAVVSVLLVVSALVSGACSADSPESGTSSSDEGATGTAAAEVASNSPQAAPSPGCDHPTGEPSVKGRQTLELDGELRWFLVTAPGVALVEEPVPLVFDFHGLSEGADFHSNSTGWSELAEQEGFVAVFPNGTGRTVAWNVASSGPNPDLDFVDSMLESLGQQYCIDTSRVYSTGLSNGAFMSSVIGCTRSSTFAAVAPVAGVTFPADCAPDRPVPVLSFHGTADPLLPFNGSVSADALEAIFNPGAAADTSAPPGDIDGEGYPYNASQWAAANGCGEPSDERVSESVLRRSWDCPESADVVFYMVEGGGHTWPGSDALASEGIAAIVGPTNYDIDATQLTWEFFQEQQLVV